MGTKRKTRSKNKLDSYGYLRFALGKRHFSLLMDKVMFLRFLKNIRGRFWGIAAVAGMLIGFGVCFIIRPELLTPSTAFSDFGNDVRTAPYFSGAVFFAAYGLWRWRRYLSSAWKRTMPVTGLITLTIIGLYLIALMPVGWEPVYYIHLFGVALAGFSMLATVILDTVLNKTRRGNRIWLWRGLRATAFALIITGGWLTFGSTPTMNLYDIALIGEVLMILGYFIWICIVTYAGQGRRTILARFLKNFVLVD